MLGSYGYLPVTLQFVFGGIIVGWTEEFLFRGCVQRVLNEKFAFNTFLGIRKGTLLAAIIFGLLHFVNIALGQSLSSSLTQFLFATFFGILIGIFYHKTNDLAGAAWIHNIVDFTTMVAPFIPI